MADITRTLFLRHLRSAETSYVRHTRRGRLAHEGVGQSFWYRALDAVLSEVPVDDRELPVLFHARTRDYQDVSVQGTVTFRLGEPDVAASRLDFSIDPVTGRWRGTPLDQVAGLLVETAQQHAAQLLAVRTLAESVTAGVSAVRDVVAAGLAADARLAEVGVRVVAVRVVALRPEPDVEKALQTPAREGMQQEADRATYERRALAVERESAIGRNELESQIALARQEEQLVAQRGANHRREAEEQAAAGRVTVEADATRVRAMAGAEAEAAEAMGAARASAERARLEAYRDLPQATLLGLALQELATNLPRVQSLVLTPDLLAPVLARLGAGDDAGGVLMPGTPRVVVVHRRTEYDELLARDGTRGQAAFFLGTRGRSIDEVAAVHDEVTAALVAVGNAVPAEWRRGSVERADLARFLFAPEDVVVAVGQDGLVANVAKYLHGQPVLGVDPSVGRNPGVLVRHRPDEVAGLLRDLVRGRVAVEERTMVEAVTDDGQSLVALNEVFLGHPSHQTARYTLAAAHASRAQASSGLIVSTGTGATGWCRSVWLERHSALALPAPTDPDLVWFVREAWPSPVTDATLTEGRLEGGRSATVSVTVQSDRLVVFGDGVEDDRLTVSWGQRVDVRRAARTLRLV